MTTKPDMSQSINVFQIYVFIIGLRLKTERVSDGKTDDVIQSLPQVSRHSDTNESSLRNKIVHIS